MLIVIRGDLERANQRAQTYSGHAHQPWSRVRPRAPTASLDQSGGPLRARRGGGRGL